MEMKIQPKEKNFLAIDEKFSNYSNSKIVIYPIPYEQTTSYGKGTQKGPKAILNASAYVEFYDDEFKKELCFEKGIATLVEPILNKMQPKDIFKLIEETTINLIHDGKFVVGLGGEHTISLPLIQAHYSAYPGMCILQFDAHSDFRKTYEGTKFSHACVMARVAEFFEPSKIIQVGIRALCKTEASFIERNNIKTFFASQVRQNKHGENWQKAVVDELSEQIYVTFDVDFFDPSVMPATGTPEPDGFFYNETLEVFREIRRQGKKIIGFDVVELSPIKDLHHPNLTTARLVYKILNFAFY
jgi:agmatinase